MADGYIIAWMSAEQADEHIAAREGAVERLEATLKAAKEDLKQARAERKKFQPHPRTSALAPPEVLDGDPQAEPTEHVAASAGNATGAGRIE
jgi:multidrug resistance efflux pump